MGLRIPALLDAILEATATEQGAKARIAAIRATLEDEARRRFIDEGAAPSWNAPRLGKVRYDPPGEWTAQVADPDAFASWVAEHHPTEAITGLAVAPEHTEAAIEALTFAGVPHVAAVRVRSAWSSTFLEALTVDVEETEGEAGAIDRAFTIVDAETGDLPPGLTATRSAGKLVVNLDRERRTVALEVAKADAEEVIRTATEGETPAADVAALDERRTELEGFHADVLTAYAKRLDLGGSGTKAQLAERIARAEALSGRRELLTASHLPSPVHDHTCPVDCGPEHDRAMESDADEQLAEPAAERGSVAYLDQKREAAILIIGSREDLRRFAKAKGIPAAGTKPDVAHRIAAAGHTADDVTTYLAQE